MEVKEKIIEYLDRQPWLDRLSEVSQNLVRNVFQSGGETGIKVRDALHGVWLGHPVHSVATDVAIGSYTASMALDAMEIVTGDPAYGEGADTSLAVGLAGAATSAITGMNDWQHTTGRPRRIGEAHALLNVLGFTLYSASWLARKKDDRRTGWGLSFLGMAVTTAAAFLGGYLVYDEKIGVDHAPRKGFPEEFTPVISLDDLEEETLTRVEVNEIPILLVRKGSVVRALAETCAHLGGPLAEGELVDGAVVCPWHASHFSLQDGSVLQGPSTFAQPCLETRIQNGQVEVRAPKEEEVGFGKTGKEEDIVIEASQESFPASDPPAWTGGPAV